MFNALEGDWRGFENREQMSVMLAGFLTEIRIVFHGLR
jgi:hypothetical protein